MFFKQMPEIKSTGKIIIVSDVHLGSPANNDTGFKRFIEEYLETNTVEHFVMLGDIFDFWEGSPREILGKHRKILRQIRDLDSTIHYVVGNHDYTIQRYFSKSDRDRFNFTNNFVIRNGEETFRFMHGHQVFEEVLFRKVLYGGLCLGLCQVQSTIKNMYTIMSKLFRKNPREFVRIPFIERLRGSFDSTVIQMCKRSVLYKLHSEVTEKLEEWVRKIAMSEQGLTKLKEEEFLIFAHFHMPEKCLKDKWANAGCWMKGEHQMDHKGFSNFSYLTIENGVVNLIGKNSTRFSS